MGATAQASVVPPDGLDLNAWFVEPPSVVIPDIPADDAEGGKMKKSKKGKVRDLGSNANLSGKKASKRNGDGALNNIMASNAETAEEIAQREKVGNQTGYHRDHQLTVNRQNQRRAERLAQLRDDPYYIMDNPSSKAVESVDSIPVVHLEDMPPIIGRGFAVQPSSCLANFIYKTNGKVNYHPCERLPKLSTLQLLSLNEKAKCQKVLLLSDLSNLQ